MLTPDQKVTLETFIDQDDLSSVLTAIAEICNGKAEHLSANWQDANGSRIWARAAFAIERCALTEPVLDTVI